MAYERLDTDLRASSTNDDYNADCDAAVVTLTAELIALILKRRATAKHLKQEDNDVEGIRYWDGNITYYSHAVFDALGIDNGDPCWEDVPDAPDKDQYEHIQNTECDVMCVSETDVYWQAIPKHSSIRIETDSFSLKDIEDIRDQCINCKELREKHKDGKCLFSPTTYETI